MSDSIDNVPVNIVENGLYILDKAFFSLLTAVGGTGCSDKERPIVTLIPSKNNPNIYWAIPMGDMSHRDEKQRQRIQTYLELKKSDIRSSYYHIGHTNKESLFFVSDVYPITLKYLSRTYNMGSCQYIIKNPSLKTALESKLKKILAFEKSSLNSKKIPFFRQNIFGIYDLLVTELSQ